MKKLICLPLLLLALNLTSQSAKFSTFEEMWVVSPEFLNLKPQGSVYLAPESMTYENLNSIKSFGDLNKIIADTPFLSITLAKAPEKSGGTTKNMKMPMINLNERYEPGKDLKGGGSWMVLFQKGDEFVIGMPTKEPEDLKAYLEQNSVMISDNMGKFGTMVIKEIRIENGTYGKNY
jgi:hypothetical protein